MSQDKVKLADVSEFSGDGSRVITEVDGQEVAIIYYDGEYYGMANYCIHQSGPLCEGALTGTVEMADDGWDWSFDAEEKYISCPWHGWMFDITTGESAKDSRLRVPTFDVAVEDGSVFY